MDLKHILVHLDHSPHCQARLEFALGLARRHQARLTGYYAVTHSYFSRRHSEHAEIQAAFLEKAKDCDVASEWHCLEEAGNSEEVIAQVSQKAHCADLVIVGQSSPKSEELGTPRDLPERLVLLSGRPVLILPYAGTFTPCCQRIMVAWQEGRESVRALHDALPLLKMARQVSLLTLTPAETRGQDVERALHAVGGHLAHHGVQARTEQLVYGTISKGDMLLNRTAEEGIDLLVTGAFAKYHPGAVARHLLNHMTVPVLMSH